VSELPAWSLPHDAAKDIALGTDWPAEVTREWAWGDATGKGVRVCILDSGVDASHPLVGHGIAQSPCRRTRTERRSSATTSKATSAATAPPRRHRPLARAGPRSTASASSARAWKGGNVLLFGLRYAVEQGFDVVNLSLSTTKKDYAAVLHELADSAYFQRTVLVASAHNMPVESYPWRFSSVISVGSHEDADPTTLYYNPNPPVEFFAKGVDVEVAWLAARP
jgi:subtilisin family serine protease